MNLDRATMIAEKIVAGLHPFCERIEIAGSIRRQRPQVNDIDIVCLPHDEAGLRARVLQSKPRVIAGGRWTIEVELANAVRLDVWIAAPATKDLFGEGGSNFGSLLLLRTGSIRHNQFLILAAKRLGLSWNPHWGLFDPTGRRVAGDTEAEIFKTLEIGFVKPEDRER